MSEATVSAVMCERVPEVSPEASASTAATRLRESDAPALVVTTPETPVAGVVTDAAIITALAKHGDDPPVSEIMASPVVTVRADDRLESAAALLREADVDVCPVVANDRAVGLLGADALAAGPRAGLPVEYEGAPVTLPAGEPTAPTTGTAVLSVLADRTTE